MLLVMGIGFINVFSLWASMEKVVLGITKETKHSIKREKWASLLDSVHDCIICHHCLGLNDVPNNLLSKSLLTKLGKVFHIIFY
jgi:hypothetical protein